MCCKDSLSILFSIAGGIILAFLILPLLLLLLSTNPIKLLETVNDPEVYSAILLSIYTGGLATGIGLLFGVPGAYILARQDFFGKNIVKGLIDIPIVVPHTAAGVALLYLFSQKAILGRFASCFGLSFSGEVAGIVVAMLFVSLPFLIHSAADGFCKVNIRLEEKARILGASSWQVFFKVSLPLARKPIFSGLIMMWARGVSEFGAVIVLAYHPKTAPILLFERFESYGLKESLPVASLLIIICLLIFISLRMINKG
jgi:molybdate/tungstate transport system permease protein